MCLSRPQNITPKTKNASRNLAAKRLKVPRVSRPVLLKIYALDFGIVSRRDGTFERTVVKKDSLVAMLLPNHPLAQAKSFAAYAMGFISEL